MRTASSAVVDANTSDHDAAAACRGLAQVIDRVGNEWTVMVVGHLSAGPLRFSA